MIVTLIGYRGTGKSRIAPLLAERLQWPWADADVELERNSGRSIREIFATDGEATFRQFERRELVDLLKSPLLVLAAGGGRFSIQTRAPTSAPRVRWSGCKPMKRPSPTAYWVTDRARLTGRI